MASFEEFQTVVQQHESFFQEKGFNVRWTTDAISFTSSNLNNVRQSRFMSRIVSHFRFARNMSLRQFIALFAELSYIHIQPPGGTFVKLLDVNDLIEYCRANPQFDSLLGDYSIVPKPEFCSWTALQECYQTRLNKRSQAVAVLAAASAIERSSNNGIRFRFAGLLTPQTVQTLPEDAELLAELMYTAQTKLSDFLDVALKFGSEKVKGFALFIGTNSTTPADHELLRQLIERNPSLSTTALLDIISEKASLDAIDADFKSAATVSKPSLITAIKERQWTADEKTQIIQQLLSTNSSE